MEEEEERRRREEEEERRRKEEERVKKEEEERKRKDEEEKERRKKEDRGGHVQQAPKLTVYRALYSFQARNSDELSIDANCLIQVQTNLIILQNIPPSCYSITLLSINTWVKTAFCELDSINDVFCVGV